MGVTMLRCSRDAVVERADNVRDHWWFLWIFYLCQRFILVGVITPLYDFGGGGKNVFLSERATPLAAGSPI